MIEGGDRAGDPPDLLVVIFHLDDDPYRDIRLAQLDTCFAPELMAAYAGAGIRVAYASSGPLTPAWRRLDQIVERLRWSRGWENGGHRILSPLVSALTLPLRSWVPTTTVRSVSGASVADWRVDVVPMLAAGRWRLLAMFEESLRSDYDYLYVTTTSSYAMPGRVQRWLAANPGTAVAGSPIHIPRLGHTIPSGANRVLRRDVVERAVADRDHLPRGVLDDVALGIWLHHMGIEVRGMPTLNLATEEEVDAIAEDELLSAVHIRLKSTQDGRRNDPRLMRQVHRILGPLLVGEVASSVQHVPGDAPDE